MTETLTVSRGATDKYAERTTTETHTVEGVFAWSRFTDNKRDRQESASTTVDLYVPRGSDVEARDRITRSNGETYAVVGHAMWDQDHPVTGRDFGWMVFQLQSTNG
jgi:hypothetical protein